MWGQHEQLQVARWGLFSSQLASLSLNLRLKVFENFCREDECLTDHTKRTIDHHPYYKHCTNNHSLSIDALD